MPLQYREAGIVEIAAGETESAAQSFALGVNEEITMAIEGMNTNVWYDTATTKFKISSPAVSGGVKIHYRIAI